MNSRFASKWGNPGLGPAKSSTWRTSAQLSHKLIHSSGGQIEKTFAIIYLGALLQVPPRFRAQVHGLQA
jgi:hypothetical protein